ncbi:MAG: alpha/beta hydrolase fold domain-containing protein [Candidatus Moduliflexus flocculans]|nr:alpha/beta hydrolase fold domain-containing protein [Candidatus Moduliflexus flocculans]
MLIRIHGGGWVSGDKGYGNMNNVNRHFASLGYLVFDLQYGLAESGTFRPRAPTPEGMLGPFGIEDMLRHIGAFSLLPCRKCGGTGADLDRVFVSGASAGGHLAPGLRPDPDFRAMPVPSRCGIGSPH